MAESTNVRLVRCPKCENLLPELADYSVYKCGGCGAVLRAKIRNGEADTFSEKSEEDRPEGVSSESQISSEKGLLDSSDTSDGDVKSSDGSLRCDQRDTEKDGDECADRSRNESKADKWSVENGNDIRRNKDETVDDIAGHREDLDSNFGYSGGSQRLGVMSDWQAGKQEEVEGFQRIPRAGVEGVRFSTSNHPDEGPSHHHLDSSYGYGETLRNRSDQDGSSRIHLEQDRAELLRKLDELKEQLSRSCDVVDKPKEKVPLDGRVLPSESNGPDAWFPNSSSGSRTAPMPFYGPDKLAAGAGPSYFRHFSDPFGYSVGHDIPRHGLYPPMHTPNHIHPYGDPFGSKILGRAPRQLPREYQQQPPHPYFSGQYIENGHETFMPYPQSAVLHQASCSCFHCYEKHRQVPASVPSGAFVNKRFPDVPGNPMYHIENPGTFGSHFHNSRTAMPPPLNVHGAQTHARWPNDINSEMVGFVRYRPKRVVLASGGRHFRPIAGGAPFITCYNCFELLRMPRRVQLMVKNEQKLRCGACSIVIKFSVANKKIILHDHAETKGNSVEVDDCSNRVVNDNSSHFRGRMNRVVANFSSDDYDHSGYDFQSMDREPVALSTGQALNSVRPQEMQSFHSSSPSTSEDENSPDVLPASREEVTSIQQLNKPTLSPPPAGSPLQDHFDYSSNNHAANRFGKGNRSSRSDQEKIVSNKATTRQNSLKEASLPTEVEVSFNEFSNTGGSQDSGDANREDDQPKMTKGGESFFVNIIKKSFKDFSRSNQTEERGKSNVSVNGHPIPERVVKKAEKMAGTIHPGQYWYDFRAGFWGVMGGPCLGIIPPFVEEFNYPMPENCAGGTTGVFVNGRELHQKDLDLLAKRGLPTERDRSYIIEISGRVLDEDTGEELDSLGKLAPTVQKVKHGFGMKVPKAAA